MGTPTMGTLTMGTPAIGNLTMPLLVQSGNIVRSLLSRYRMKALSVWCLSALLLTGCTTTNSIQQAHWQFLSGDARAAANTLGNSDEVARKDKLLYWLEKGMYLHYAGDYQASTRELLKAASFVEGSDYISLADEARELLTNEWASSYRGEYSEQLWIHSILMMNFLHSGKFESAAVEARRALKVIESKPDVLNNDHFTRSLIALSFEAAGQINDAYIVNRKLSSDAKHLSLNQLLFEQAFSLGFTIDAANLQSSLDSGNTNQATSSARSTAIIFIPSGHVPQKFSGSLITSDVSRLAFPQYVIPASRPGPYSIMVNGEACDCQPISSDLGNLVNHSLNKRGTALAAKSLLRAAAKDAVADSVSDADEIVGEITRLLLFALEEADTRSWRSLPRHFTMVRVPLPDDSTEWNIQVTRNRNTVNSVAVFTLDSGKPLQFISVVPQQLKSVE